MLRLKHERLSIGMSQAELARRTGSMHPSSVYQIEHGIRKPGFKQRCLIEMVMRDAGWNGEDDLFEEADI